MSWQIRLWGDFGIVGGEGQALLSKSQNSKFLLAWLASVESHRLSRRLVAATLFDPDELPASSNLSVLLNRTRTALSRLSDTPLLLTDPESLWLAESDVVIDAWELNHAAQMARKNPENVQACFALAEAIGAISGPPLLNLEFPAFVPIRRELVDLALNAMLALADGPLASQFRSLILQKLEVLGLLNKPSSLTIERVLMILGRLRMRDLLIATYLQFEDFLADEIGEAPSPEVTALFDQLAKQIESTQIQSVNVGGPARPERSFGGNEWIARIGRQVIGASGASRVWGVIGQGGIGKTHFLSELYWHLGDSLSVLYVDLEKIPLERVFGYLKDQAFEVLLIDHLAPENHSVVEELERAYPHVPIIFASPTRIAHLADSTIVLRGLEIGNVQTPGPAMELIVAARHAVISQAKTESVDWPAVQAIAELCDGIPLALEFAGKLSATIGLDQTQKSLTRDLRALGSSGRTKGRHSSLSGAIRSSFDYLSSGAQTVVQLLTQLGQPCHMDHLMNAGELSIYDVEDALMSGLVVREPDSAYIRVVRSTAWVVRDQMDGNARDELLAKFDRGSCRWFGEMEKQIPLDLSLSPSASLGIDIANRLFRNDDPNSAFALLGSLRSWLGSGQVSIESIETLVPFFLDHADPNDLAWISAALSLGAAMFHIGAYAQMHAFLEKAWAQHESQGIRTDLHGQLLLQCMLAKRCLGHVEEAIEGYVRVVTEGQAVLTPSTMVKGFLNLGTTLEALDRLPEALGALESAKANLGADADPRTESLILLGIARLRFRIGDNLAEVAMVFEALQAHALHRGDIRVFSEILQNSGLVYLARGEALTSALAETLGSAYLLQFGYSTEFRRLTKSSFVTLGTALMSLGESHLANRTRILIDRLGSAALYAPNQLLFNELEASTYETPSAFSLSIAPELEIVGHVQECYRRLVELADAQSLTPSLKRLLAIPVPQLLELGLTKSESVVSAG